MEVKNINMKITEIINNQIRCIKCNIEKDIRYFYKRPEHNSYRSACNTCSKGYKTSLIDKQEFIQNLIAQNLKECGRCKEIKSIQNFGLDKYTKHGYASNCKKCISESNKGKNKFVALKTKYGVTPAKYNELLTTQNYNCAICNSSLLNLDNKHIHLDHCHTTGKVRGILCSYCNLGLGNFKDNIQNLKNAINYLNNN